jgi:3(or 17)beta-hydroxysteroid dehydrogenase
VPNRDSEVALVTGGASGLGKAIAGRLVTTGVRVVVSDIQTELGRETALEVGATFIEQDVCSEEGWLDVIQEVERRFGALTILVNNAGIAGPMVSTNPENTPFELWKKLFAVNVDGVFLGCRAAIPAMRRAGRGSIVNICSIASLLATPYNSAYGATKATVRQLTRSVAQHCAQEKLNVRCNSVHPGVVRTPLWDRVAAENAARQGISLEDYVARAKAKVPLRELATADDVAAAVAFLASEDARLITGTELIVDGGYIGCDTMRDG